jgi:hypothetical protein
LTNGRQKWREKKKKKTCPEFGQQQCHHAAAGLGFSRLGNAAAAVAGRMLVVLGGCPRGCGRFGVGDHDSCSLERVATLVGALGGHVPQPSAVQATAFPKVGRMFLLREFPPTCTQVHRARSGRALAGGGGCHGLGVGLALVTAGLMGGGAVSSFMELEGTYLRVQLLAECYTLNTTGSEYGYGPGRKVSETRHTVLGRHTETGQPTASGLGSGQPTLRHQEVPGPSTGADRESASAAAEEDNLGGHHKKDKQSEGNGNARSCESRSRNRSGVVSRGTAQRNNTTSRESLYRCIVADSLEARGDTAAPRCQETRGIMLPLASLSLTPDYGDEPWALPAHGSVSVSPPIRGAYNGYDAGHTLH